MGGKTKQNQRTKNNAKPSSSSRSAELLGVPTFVGFSAHSDLGLVPFAPGFSTADQMPDTFDASINPQFQLIMRKMSKKDPMTKKKALQEFIDIVQTADLDTIKSILPLWPKFYHNLAGDTEHNVRELAQTVQQLLVSKCKRAVAPYLKQLVPVWLVSHFDNYAPAASIASVSFRDTFAGNANRIQEVCLHCQTEIVEFVARNLTFHTAATLSSGKGLAPEEAEQKYQRTIVCSLRALSFFVEHTREADLTQVHENLKTLLGHQKFWTYAKHKLPTIKAAWFELIYNLLQHPNLTDVVLQSKSQIITLCFQNLDESDPIVAPQVWGCILLLQSNYDDWHKGLCFKKTLLPKLSQLLRNQFNRNAQAICPNLLPFFSKLSADTLTDIDWNEFCQQFFNDFKTAVCAPSGELPLSKADSSLITKSYFECLRFLLQKLNNSNPTEEEVNYAKQLLEENVLDLVEWSMKNDSVAVKYIYQHIAALAAFWTDRQQSGSSPLYTQLLDVFWKRIFQLITKTIEKKEYMERILELVQSLHSANPSLEDQRVKFAESDLTTTGKTDTATTSKADEKKTVANESNASFIQKELKQLVVQLVQLCLENMKEGGSAKCLQSVRRLTKMFPDAEFYASITSDKSLLKTLNLFVELIDKIDEQGYELLVDIVFDILHLLPTTERFAYIKANLLKLPQEPVQSLILQRLLSYPLCIEPEMKSLLSTSEASNIVVNVARRIIVDKSKDQFNLLHKCFFQNDAGEILIDSRTVDALLHAVAAPLEAPDFDEMADVCGSFIAQVMPVICSNDNASLEVQREIFLLLFKISMSRNVSEFMSQDTLWEITTCWEDALSSDDITVDEALLEKCAATVRECLQSDNRPTATINGMADALAKFMICSTENIDEEEQRGAKIDAAMMAYWRESGKISEGIGRMAEHCLFLESLKGVVSSDVELNGCSVINVDMSEIYRHTLLKFCTIYKLVCKAGGNVPRVVEGDEGDDEYTLDYCDPNANLLKHWSEQLYAEILRCIHIAAIGDSLVNHSTELTDVVESLMLELSETVVLFMGNESEIVGQVKEKLLSEALKETNVLACRSLTYLVHYQQYAQFEENATILLAEELSEYFVGENALRAYIGSLQYLLPKLEPRSITMQSAIMRTTPDSIWIKSAVFRCLVCNNFCEEFNERSDRNIIATVLRFVTEVAERQHQQKDLLLYNVDIQNQKHSAVVDVVEYINLLKTILEKFPQELTIKNWDAIRIGLSSWVLSVSKCIEAYNNPKAALFISSVYRLFAALTKFIIAEKQRSSTEILKNVIDEWESLFVREVTLVLFKAFYTYANLPPDTVKDMECYVALLEELIPAMELLDYGIVYNFCKSSSKITLDNVCNFLLRNLSNSIHCMRVTCVYILRKLTCHFVADDIEIYEKKSETFEGQELLSKWHYLNRFEDYLSRYDFPIQKYLKEFSFKITEVSDFEPLDRNEAFSYLLLWDCIIYACANSPVALRSVYTSWLNENKFEENLLHFLFRGMPIEILKNYDSKLMNSDIFKGLTWAQITDRNLSLEKYVCHLYAEVLRKLPAVVRKWWNTSPSRQKSFVDKLTTNFVSPLICNEELKSIGNKKEKHENMQVTVHMSTREVLAVYSIDEARMELVITLAPNYPLGAVKVECGKQIGGRASSRNVGMQLTIFLTHQNGTIFDGLTLWKNNLDKKFEGVEECYVCYTVIHQDTCQLPKLTCKTCKKKFHGPCLYKWFTTSSKSTCPICRNVF